MTQTVTYAPKRQHLQNNAPKDITAPVGYPTRFYKYRGVSGESGIWTSSILLRNEVFFATRGQLNDPFDCRPRFSGEATIAERYRFLKGVLKHARYLPQGSRNQRDILAKRLSMENEVFNAAMRDAIDHVEQRLYHQIGIFCLSTKPDDILMWSHYADSH